MRYKDICEAVFVRRPNRFIAICELEGREVICHVKNTGRCRELLLPGVRVYLDKSGNPGRKTEYDLLGVMKGELLFNIDSQAPNRVASEWLAEGGFFEEVSFIRPECKYKNSRFDFYIEQADGRRSFIEVKGVTLEENGVLMFPDAPTERGVKHLSELCEAVAEGYRAYVLFVIQTERAEYFTPNRATHPEFADALRAAVAAGVEILCYSCKVTPDSLEMDRPIEVRL